MSPTPDRTNGKLDRLIAMPRPQVRKLAEIRANAGAVIDSAGWALYVVHLIDIIEGYERAITNAVAPASNGTDTSDHAARTLAPSIAGRRAIVLEKLARRADLVALHKRLTADDDGMTCREIVTATGWSHGSASARVNELGRLGYIVDTGRRRITSTAPGGREFYGAVHEITDLGRDVLTQHTATEGATAP